MPVRPRTRNKQQKISQIKKTFISLVETHGYLETTNKLIAKRAQVSVGLIYKYFPHGKVDILRQLVLDSQAVYLATEEQQSTSLPFSIKDQSLSLESLQKFIHQMLGFIVDGHVKNAKFMRALEIAMLADPSTFEDLLSWAQQTLSLKPIIVELQKFKIIDKSLGEKEMVINTNIIDSVIHRYMFYPSNPFSSREDFLNYLCDLFIQLFKIEAPK